MAPSTSAKATARTRAVCTFHGLDVTSWYVFNVKISRPNSLMAWHIWDERLVESTRTFRFAYFSSPNVSPNLLFVAENPLPFVKNNEWLILWEVFLSLGEESCWHDRKCLLSHCSPSFLIPPAWSLLVPRPILPRYRRSSTQVSVLPPMLRLNAEIETRAAILPQNTSVIPHRYRWGIEYWSGR